MAIIMIDILKPKKLKKNKHKKQIKNFGTCHLGTWEGKNNFWDLGGTRELGWVGMTGKITEISFSANQRFR